MESVLYRLIETGRKDLDVDLGDRSAALALRPRPHCATSPLLNVHLSCEAGGAPVDLFLPPTLFSWCLDAVATGVSKATFDPATAALLFEAALAEPLDRLETALGAPIVVKSAEVCAERRDEWTKPDLVFAVNIAGLPPFAVNAFLSAETGRKVLSLWSRGEVDNVDPDVVLVVRVGLVRLPAGEVHALRPDDVVMLDETPLHAKQVLVIADETLGARASLDGRTLKIEDPLQPVQGSWIEQFVDRDPMRPAMRPQPETGVVVTAELARRVLPLSSLERFDLQKPNDLHQGLDGVIDLCAQGIRIATGRLVMAGSAFGVRILGVTANG